jgi:hypothetical protein
MKKILLLLTICLAAAVEGQPITTVQVTNAPRTYFETVNATPDTLLIKGSSVIGTVSGTYPVEIRAERVTNPQTTNTVYAVSLRTKFDQNATQVDYIDYDELDALIRSVQYIGQATSAVTPMDNFETVFRTRSGLSIAKVGRGNKVVIAMTPGYVNAARNPMPSFVLDELGRDLTAAKTKIDAVIASGQ